MTTTMTTTMTERLTVLLYGQTVGHLERSGTDDPSFTYTTEYAAAGRAPVSSRLPITVQTYRPDRVLPYLRGLLPENLQTRQQWAAGLGTSPDDAFGLLAAMGWDCPGAVQFTPEDHVTELQARAAELNPLTEHDIAERLRFLQDQPASWTMPGEHWSLGGQQEKFALTWVQGQWHEAGGSAATTHIVKPGIKVLHHQALVEHVTMRAAAATGVSVAASRLLPFEDQWAIVIDRFDRATSGDRVFRLHQEDFCQALGRLPEKKYESAGGPGLRDMAGLVRKQMTQPEDDLRALADFLAVNVVAGAPDGHAKNISLILGPDGSRWIAPLYDLATGLAYDAGTVERSVALSVGGERIFSRIRGKQWDKAAQILGLDPELVRRRVAALATGFPAAFESALDDVSDAPGAADVAERTLPVLQKHCSEVLDRLAE